MRKPHEKGSKRHLADNSQPSRSIKCLESLDLAQAGQVSAPRPTKGGLVRYSQYHRIAALRA